ncbi:MAG: hypothetical protein HYX27_08875 [Acidobacteria bacterium]|nr:hypothetical protein [Acidobacteriota bacterium]
MIVLPQKFAFQHRERLDALGWIVPQISLSPQPPDMMLFEQSQARRPDEGLRTLRQQHRAAGPYRPLGSALVLRQISAAALLFQALRSAFVALPRGLVRELELEGDD